MGRPEELRDLSPSVQTVVTEAADQGFEGMKRVGKVIYSRAQLPRWKGKSADDIVQEPKQFSGWERPDRAEFLAKQPVGVFEEAARALKAAAQDTAGGKVFADHYLTTALYDDVKKRPSWANQMQVVERYGGHVFLKE